MQYFLSPLLLLLLLPFYYTAIIAKLFLLTEYLILPIFLYLYTSPRTVFIFIILFISLLYCYATWHKNFLWDH